MALWGIWQSLLPGVKFAERFADYGITGLAVSLFGAEGLPEGGDRIPLESLQKVWAEKSFSIQNLWGIAEKIITNWNEAETDR